MHFLEGKVFKMRHGNSQKLKNWNLCPSYTTLFSMKLQLTKICRLTMDLILQNFWKIGREPFM